MILFIVFTFFLSNNKLKIIQINFVILIKFPGLGTASKSQSLNICGDWISYKNEKCFQFVNKLGTEEEAKSVCYQLDKTSTLISIESEDEQAFLSDQLGKYQSVSDKVWMGMNVHDLVLNPWNGKKRYSFTAKLIYCEQGLPRKGRIFKNSP